MATDQKFDNSFKLRYLKPKFWVNWFLLGVLGVLSFIPARVRDFFCNLVVGLLSSFTIKHKKLCLINLKACFPDLTLKERKCIYRDNLRVGLKVILGYGELFFRGDKFIEKSFMVTGREYLDEALATGRPIVFMAPHAWAIDRCGIYLSMIGLPMCTMMHSSGNEVYDWFMNSMRLRYGGRVYERNSGIKCIIRALKDGYHAYFLPDQDLGPKSAVFVPFFGKDKASLVVLPKIAALSNAIIVPFFSCYNEERHCYEVVLEEYFKNYPSADLTADVRKMNAATEHLILGREKQYMWFLKYFKTNKPGETQIYGLRNPKVQKMYLED